MTDQEMNQMFLDALQTAKPVIGQNGQPALAVTIPKAANDHFIETSIRHRFPSKPPSPEQLADALARALDPDDDLEPLPTEDDDWASLSLDGPAIPPTPAEVILNIASEIRMLTYSFDEQSVVDAVNRLALKPATTGNGEPNLEED